MKRFVFSLVGLSAIATTAFASPYYGFVGFGYGLSSDLKSTSSSIFTYAGGFGTVGVQQQYAIDSEHAFHYLIGGGYKFKPLFAPGIIKSNAIEVSLSYNNTQYNGARVEHLNTSYTPGDALGVHRTIPFSIYQKRINVMGDYVLNFKPLSKTLSWFVKAGLGLSRYQYKSDENEDATASIATENFNKKGVNAFVNAGIGLDYEIAKRYTLTLGYQLTHYLQKETVRPTWTAGADDNISAATLASAENSVSLTGSETTNQLYIRFAMQF